MKGSLSIAVLSLLGSLSSTVHGAALPQDSKSKPVIPGIFPDPSIIQVGKTWYAFATNARGETKDHVGPNVQISTSPDGKKWTSPDGKQDALPHPGCWVNKGAAKTNGPDVWAPHVVELPNPRGFHDSQFVMYYAAEAKGSNRHCIGAAVSTNIEGPYLARAEALVCPPGKESATDPAGFQDKDGKLYVVYRTDGPSTPIMMQGLRDDGVTPEGVPKQILARDAGDAPLIQAPSLVLYENVYYLFFSEQCNFQDSNWRTSYATSQALFGPYKKFAQPLIAPGGTYGLVSPGSAMIATEAMNTSDPKQKLFKMAFHAWVEGKRSMFIGDVTLNKGTASFKLESAGY
jgi:beta-xylosidase